MVSIYRNAACRLIVGASLIALPATAAWADDDSSADASGGYTEFVGQTTAVILKVPINDRGEELVKEAKMHTYTGEALTAASGKQIKLAFEAGQSVDVAPTITENDISRDSSTWGWRRWCGNYGYRANYYYNYSPTYYGGNNYYGYGAGYGGAVAYSYYNQGGGYYNNYNDGYAGGYGGVYSDGNPYNNIGDGNPYNNYGSRYYYYGRY